MFVVTYEKLYYTRKYLLLMKKKTNWNFSAFHEMIYARTCLLPLKCYNKPDLFSH